MSFLQRLDRMTQPFGGYCGGGGGGGSSTSTTSIDPDIKKRVTPALDVAQQTYEQELGIGGGPALGYERYEAGKEGLDRAYQGLGQDVDFARQQARQQAGLGQAVAGQEGRFGEGIGETRDLAQQAIGGTGIFDNTAAVQRDLQNLQGQQLAGGQGTLGSARADRARQAGLADRSLQHAQARQQTALGGASALTGLADRSQQAALQGQQLQTGAAQQLQQAGEAGLGIAQGQRQLAQQEYDVPHESLSRFFGYLGNAPQGSSTTQKQGGGK